MATETARKWTPGPWKVFMSTSGFHMIGIGQADTAQGITDSGFGVWGGGDAESLANANLLAASPDMYEALAIAREALGANAARDVVDAALSKANGERV